MGWAIATLFVFLLASNKGQGVKKPAKGFETWFYSWLADEEGRVGTSWMDAEVGGRGNCVIRQDNQIIENPSVSRGVTWGTFVRLAILLKYEPSCQNFASLSNNPPSPLWLKIVQHFTSKGYTYTKNPILAWYIGLWYWGGWDQELVSAQEVLDITKANITDKAKLNKLVDLRIHYFEEVGRTNPAKKLTVPKWIARAERFKKGAQQFV